MMFTGIVEELGDIIALDTTEDGMRLTVHGPRVTSDAAAGDSIAVNGCCLTVVETAEGRFTADVMAETLRATAMGALTPGASVNLERPVTVSTRLGGHLVQGHIDGTGTILRREQDEHGETVWIELPHELVRYIAMKGSVALDGVSLTVSGLDTATSSFAVSLIPTTLQRTTLGHKQPDETVNVEVDVLAKYAERLLAAEGAERR